MVNIVIFGNLRQFSAKNVVFLNKNGAVIIFSA
jgi:hypothetical protein